MIRNITKYKPLHLHRTCHFKTLRDLSEGKEILFVSLFLFCLFPSEENTLEWNRMLHLLVCLKQILALNLRSPS